MYNPSLTTNGVSLMPAPTDRKYTQTHEWHKQDGDTVTLGLTQFAVEELADITYIEFTKQAGDTISAGDPFGEIESVKATSDLLAGIDGEIVEVNEALLDNPATINQSPFDNGWFIKIKPSNPDQINDLLSAEDYDNSIGSH